MSDSPADMQKCDRARISLPRDATAVDDAAMEHQDAEVSDVVVVLRAECAEKLDETTQSLVKMGMQIEKTDSDNGVIEGTIGTDHVQSVKKWPCVEYVRIDFTYIADYPPGDPRNLDPVDTDDNDEED